MATPLKFNAEGNFKIVQFTDLHKGPAADKTTGLMCKILDYEKPDLVLLTGDTIDGKCKTVQDIKKAINSIAEPMETRKLPWAVTFGNHDDEHHKMSKEEMMKIYMNFVYNISKVGYKTFDRIGNYNILIENSKSNTPELNLFMLDSGKYAPFPLKGYNWIKKTQIHWYRKTALNLKRKYSKLIPSLMFFHIPLPEFKEAWCNQFIDGNRFEDECCPKINSGFFNTLVKAGDVKGVFVGHDHINTYCASLKGIRLGYAGHTGYGGYGKDNIPHSARIFLINEFTPENYRTWIRYETDSALTV